MDTKTYKRGSEAIKRYHASRTPEQKAAWRERVSLYTSVGMDNWHARRTPEQRERSRQLQTDAAVCQLWIPRGPRPGHIYPTKGKPVSAEERVARIEWSRVHKASVKRILKDIAENNPELIRDAIIDGLQAPAPRSYPYLALAAAYLDGRPPDAESAAQPADDYSNLSDAELFERARNVTQRLKTAIAARVTGSEARQLPVIDAEVIPQPEPSK